jgi:citrate lyase subunit beta/citryl-CoA lyase
MTIRPRRSVLYMPGANARALEKAKTLAVDSLILDLEDAVAPDAKQLARDQVVAAVKAGGFGEREVIIRINALNSPWGEADLAAAVAAAPDGILVPKVGSAANILTVAAELDRLGASARTAVWAMIETPTAILNAREIAATARQKGGGRLTCFVLGTNDLAKETRARLVPGRAPMLAWLSTAVLAARAYGLDVIDGVFNDLDAADAFRAECIQGLDLGMDGKSLIHPRQIETANEIFSPSPTEIAWAESVLAAFALPENAAKGVVSLDGRMVERLHADMALRTIAIARLVAPRATAA